MDTAFDLRERVCQREPTLADQFLHRPLLRRYPKPAPALTCGAYAVIGDSSAHGSIRTTTPNQRLASLSASSRTNLNPTGQSSAVGPLGRRGEA